MPPSESASPALGTSPRLDSFTSVPVMPLFFTSGDFTWPLTMCLDLTLFLSSLVTA